MTENATRMIMIGAPGMVGWVGSGFVEIGFVEIALEYLALGGFRAAYIQSADDGDEQKEHDQDENGHGVGFLGVG